jgi:hypothetical protein
MESPVRFMARGLAEQHGHENPRHCERKRSNPEASSGEELDCFVAEPVIGRAFARPVGTWQ